MVDANARARLRELTTEHLGLAPSALVDTRLDAALARLDEYKFALESLTTSAFTAPAWQAVIGAVTIGETNFFRQPGWFAQLEQQILRPALEGRESKRLRIWSAGCATGEEAYSLAMLVDRLLPKNGDWDIGITGTDINLAFLGEARAATYREWALREVDEATRERHFRKTESGRFELLPATRDRVSFEPLNLCGNGGLPSGVDLIICRNVLMYLAPERQRAIAQRLIASLAPGGWLATAPAEANAEWFLPLTPVNVPSAIFFHKSAPGDVPSPARPNRVPLPAHAPADLSESAAGLAAARRALDTSLHRTDN
jgi:chemotaxis protein methyltransferase CheR